MGALMGWGARVANTTFPGSYSRVPNPGELALSCVLTDAGVHTGREVRVVISPDELDVIQAMVNRAIALRDTAESDGK